MSSQLSIDPVRPAGFLPEETILALGRDVLESTKTWKVGKTFAKGTVRTLSRAKGPGDGAPWHCRVSEHTKEDATFDEFWSKIGTNKPENEKEFISAIKKVTLVKRISDTQSIWTMYYTFPPPVSPRVFTVLQTIHLNESSPRTAMIVSIPVDLSGPGDEEFARLEEKGIKGRYVSVERLLELDDGIVEWRMATSSTPGGSIPSFIAEGSMPAQISADVPHFLKWFHTIRNEGNA
ncbi:uncharacterized protein EDB91DRAFT_1092688 [Suillus paluster]|uniref:uncharacterized protein n=1 Tax=Suillus paluster TaxID=48578 RepID=UPI001B866AD8|nr:uncharacterized protein EDB91DRAFT_1092688 [Suillus paluster]KAG1756436.1 hypothetical protein EDB91DRAFT_1092688 [Suillus paluster]